MAIWAAAARHERIEARRAKDENHALRTAVNDRAESIEHLRRIFLKKINRFTVHFPLCSHEKECFHTLERIDDHTIYERFNQLQSLDERLVSNTIRKLFRGPDKDVVICRTVLHDAAYPVDTATPTLVDDMAGCVFQVPLEAHGASMSTPPTHYDMEEIISVLHTMSFVSSAQPTPRTTMHIQHAQTLDLTAISTPVPSMGTFLPRGKDFELAIKASLNAAIATAHAGARPRHPTQNPLRPGDLKHSNLK
ncbi:hypothetical protein B5M09_003813 [Aphanomyces astaci]|uniref:Uncharacterized protein n=1 Tax=Aphanomyces astaci TaxID=112090 RepID=A0A3R7WHL0_APHAT|nr:hypothetical protein B5M09_003813 [Aphanomyces astaci]